MVTWPAVTRASGVRFPTPPQLVLLSESAGVDGSLSRCVETGSIPVLGATIRSRPWWPSGLQIRRRQFDSVRPCRVREVRRARRGPMS